MAVDESRITTSVEKREDCVRVIDVEVSADEVKERMDKLFDEIGPSMSVPGFRPGKAPKQLLKRKFHKTVHQEAVDAVIAGSFETACEKENIEIVNEPVVENVESDDENEPIKYRATVEVQPVVKLGKYKGLKLERPLGEVTDEMVDEAIDNMRRVRATVEQIESRGVAMDDFVTIDIEVFEGDERVDDLSREGMNMRITEPAALPELQALLLDKGVGDSFEGEFTVPEDSSSEHAGKKFRAAGTVKSIKERVMPELTDEWVKEVEPDCETVDDLKKSVRDRMTEEAEKEADKRLEETALDAVLDVSEFEIPRSVVAGIAAERFRDRINQLRMSGMSQEVINSNAEAIADATQQSAERSLKVHTALNAIVEAEQIEVSDEDIEQEIDAVREYGRKMGWDLDEVERRYSKGSEQRELVRARLAREKAVKTVIDAAKVKDVKLAENDEPTED